MPRSTYKISHRYVIVDQIDRLANRIFFIQKSLSPCISFLPRISTQICQVQMYTDTMHVDRYIHYTHRAIFRSIIYAQRRSATCYIHHLYPHHSNFIYVYEFYEILISPWEIITLISAITDSIRPNSFNTLPVTCISPNIVDIQGSVKVLDNDFLWI